MERAKVRFCWLWNRAEFKLNGFSVIFSRFEGVRACWRQGWKLEVRFWDALPGKSSSEIISGADQQCQFFLGFTDRAIRR